jgi:hypothetical protein
MLQAIGPETSISLGGLSLYPVGFCRTDGILFWVNFLHPDRPAMLVGYRFRQKYHKYEVFRFRIQMTI